jgi:hypothetical protein
MNTQSSMHPRRTLLQLTLLGSLLLAGCASVPDLGPAASSKTMQDMASQQTLTPGNADWMSSNWWQSYQDGQLNDIMQEALASRQTWPPGRGWPRLPAGRADRCQQSAQPGLEHLGDQDEAKL